MQLRAALAVVALLASSCGGGDAATTTITTMATTPPNEADIPQLMGLALHELVAEDNSFGGAGHRFTELLVQDRIDPAAGGAFGSELPGRLLTTEERAAIEAALADLGLVRWIQDPDDYRTEGLEPLSGSAIIGVGEPRFDDDGALVPVSLWCGGLCGIWLTYRLVQTDDGWSVVGPEGPMVIS